MSQNEFLFHNTRQGVLQLKDSLPRCLCCQVGLLSYLPAPLTLLRVIWQRSPDP